MQPRASPPWTEWWQGLRALTTSEPLTTPGEATGNLLGVMLVYCLWGSGYDPRSLSGAAALAGLNLLRLVASYGLIYALFYGLCLFRGHKFSPEYPGKVRLGFELRYWVSSAVIGTVYDLAMRAALPPLDTWPLPRGKSAAPPPPVKKPEVLAACPTLGGMLGF